jgi:hypothetical protein
LLKACKVKLKFLQENNRGRCSFSCPLCFSVSKQKSTKVSWNSVQLQCFQVRKENVLKEKNENTGKNKLEKTFANNLKVFLGTNSKKYVLSDFEEKKKLNLLLFFLSLGQIVL